jgi:hypothetical protein
MFGTKDLELREREPCSCRWVVNRTEIVGTSAFRGVGVGVLGGVVAEVQALSAGKVLLPVNEMDSATSPLTEAA